MPSPLSTSAIIIGAGPAGAATSIYLSKAGIPHLILDKDTFPRDKVCGDAVSGKSAFVMRKVAPEWLHEIYAQPDAFLPTSGILFVAPNGKELDIPYTGTLKPGEPAPGFTAPRTTFDHFLFKKINRQHAQVFEGATVISIERKGGGVEVEFRAGGELYKATAPLLVGADGDKGIVRKTFFNEGEVQKTGAVGLRAYYSGVAGLHEKNFIELHFLPEMLPGYLWIFPMPGGMANVGVGMPSELIRKKGLNLRAMMLAALENNPAMKARFANATLHGKILGWGLPMTGVAGPLSFDNLILTGDAAGLVDPFSGEGIGNAMYSGMLAASAIEAALEARRFDAAFLKEKYNDSITRRLGNEMRISSTMQRLCRKPWLFNAVVNKARKSPVLRETISCMFADIDVRDQLRRPSFYLKVLLNK